MWGVTILIAIVAVYATTILPDQFDCRSGYDQYRSFYPLVKEGANVTLEMSEAFMRSCSSIKRKSQYSSYQMEYTILADFPPEVINDLQYQPRIEYTGVGSEEVGIDLVSEEYHSELNGMDRIFDDDLSLEYSKPYGEFAGCSLSWATSVVKAAESVLRLSGYDVKLSWRYLLECLPRYSLKEGEDACDGIRSKEIIEFIQRRGLIVEKEGVIDDICHVDSAEVFRFDIKESEGANKYGLMNLVSDSEGGATVVLMAIDIERLRYVKDMRNREDVIRCASSDPSLYGMVVGYKNSVNETDGYWEIESNVVPYENIFIRIPLTSNEASANYAGIAAFPFSLHMSSVPREFIVDDSYGSIDAIPSWVESITFRSNSFIDVDELVLNRFPNLKSVIFEDGSFANAVNLSLDLPSLEELIVGEDCFSGMDMGRRLSLGRNSLGRVNRIEYNVEISISVVISIKKEIESKPGRDEEDIIIEDFVPTTRPPNVRPTIVVPTTTVPTSLPTTLPPTTLPSTILPPTTLPPTTLPPIVTESPTALPPIITESPTTQTPIMTEPPTTQTPIMTEPPTTLSPVVTELPTTLPPIITESPTTLPPIITEPPTTQTPIITESPTTLPPIITELPTTQTPIITEPPITQTPIITESPTTLPPIITEPPTTQTPIFTEPPTTQTPIFTEPPTTQTPIITEPPTTLPPIITESPTTLPPSTFPPILGTLCEPGKVALILNRTYTSDSDEEYFYLYSLNNNTPIYQESFTGSSLTYNVLCLNPEVYRLELTDSYGDGWFSGSKLVLSSEFDKLDEYTLSNGRLMEVLLHPLYGELAGSFNNDNDFFCSQLLNFPDNAVSLLINSDVCNTNLVAILNISNHALLSSIDIGSDSFYWVGTLIIDTLDELRVLNIGSNSFTSERNSFGNNPSRSFHVLSCEKLESIEIGDFSFSDYSGEFELVNLPSLVNVSIGAIDSYSSNNFYYSSFIVEDLPSLFSLKLGSGAFHDSLRTVINCLTSYLDIPNLEVVAVPDSFRNVEYLIMHNVSVLLSNVIPITINYWESLDSSITSLIIADLSINKEEFTIYNISRFDKLEELVIGDNSFMYVNIFIADGLNELKSITVGTSSFRINSNNNPSRSFHVMNCEKLESIEIGVYSFSDYAGEFELYKLPSLSSIKIGAVGSESCNFQYSSFVVKDLPNLQSIEMSGWYTFRYSLSTEISNLPNLKFIHIGWNSVEGRNVASCSLVMKDLPKLETSL